MATYLQLWLYIWTEMKREFAVSVEGDAAVRHPLSAKRFPIISRKKWRMEIVDTHFQKVRSVMIRESVRLVKSCMKNV